MSSYEGLEYSDDQRLSELVQKYLVQPLSITERAVELVSHHRKVAASIGGVALGAIGFSAGAIKAHQSH